MSERLYYADSSLLSFDAQVADIREISRNEGHSLWQIALDRSAFYPTSGGQPHDIGTLTATSPGGATLEVPILAVEEDEKGEVWHTATKPLPAGTAVQGRVDDRRRRDHVQQHSGQHLLSAAFRRSLGAATVSFHLGEAVSTIDLSIKHLASADLERVEEEVNRIIAEDRPITTRTVSRDEAEALLAAGVLAKLPPREGPIRLIEIDGVDCNACGGTHADTTGQIGGLLIRGAESVRQGQRVEFVCGLRAVAAARRDLEMLNRAAASLSVGRPQVPEAVQRLLGEEKAGQKERHKMREELADYHAARLLVEEPIEEGLRVVRRIFDNRDAGYIKLLASRLTASAPQTCALLVANAGEPATVVLACSRDLELDCGSILREALAVYGMRGGGSAGMAQGEISKVDVEALLTAVEARCAEV